MKISLSNLINGENVWQESVTPKELELDLEKYPNPVIVSFRAFKRFGKLDLKVQSSCVVPLLCDRCGEDFPREISGRCVVHFIQRDEPLPDEAPGDDVRSYRLGQDELDVTCEVRDALLLGMPIHILCDESCKGLCLRCGANLNTDQCRCVPEES